MRHLLLAGCAALVLAGCATSPNARLDEGRGLAAQWAALDGVATTLDSLALSRTLHGAKAIQASRDLEAARQALAAADAAYALGQVASAQASMAQATTLIAALVAIAQAPR